MPRETLERAIKEGAGLLTTAAAGKLITKALHRTACIIVEVPDPGTYQPARCPISACCSAKASWVHRAPSRGISTTSHVESKPQTKDADADLAAN